MTKKEFEQKKTELAWVEGDLSPQNVQKIFTILKDVNDTKLWNEYYSSSVDFSKANKLDYSLPQYKNYAK